MNIESIFSSPLKKINNVYILNEGEAGFKNQQQTNEAFTNKWDVYSKGDMKGQERLFDFQKKWYLTLYGFSSEDDLANYLKGKALILDTGCGLGYKTKWFAELAPGSTVLGIDYSDAVITAAERYKGSSNIIWVKGDIADTGILPSIIGYVSCDQVIMHTENPEKTFEELVRILKPECDFAVYVYAKKALPRELLDDHFRSKAKSISHESMMEFSKQLTDLGKMLSELNIKIDVPSIPLLEIKGGKIDLQRFIYWNFIKCFWSEEMGYSTSVITNYDWYSPSNAKRYSADEFMEMVNSNNLDEIYFHSEEACYSGRFRKKCVE
jgi:SAM-dependent methyltransferase